MKREDVIKLFPDATEEQITSALNAFHKEIDDAKEKAKSVRDENAAKVAELQAEDADKLIETMGSDKFDPSVIGTMIANAISAHDKDKMQRTPDPSGAQGNTDTRSDAEKIAESMYSGSSNQEKSVISNYL